MRSDIVGVGDLVEILGDDDSGDAFVGDSLHGDSLHGDDAQQISSIVGQAVAAALNPAARAAMAQKRVRDGQMLRTVAPRSAREYALGLGSTSVAGSSSANINVQPQLIFRPERIVVPSNIAPDFMITDIKVGKNSQLVSTGALPSVGFTETAFGVRLKMDTCQISMFVTITVSNQNGSAKTFQGMIVGPAVE